MYIHTCVYVCIYVCIFVSERDLVHQRPSIYSSTQQHIPIAQGALIIDEVKVHYFLWPEYYPFDISLIRWG